MSNITSDMVINRAQAKFLARAPYFEKAEYRMYEKSRDVLSKDEQSIRGKIRTITGKFQFEKAKLEKQVNRSGRESPTSVMEGKIHSTDFTPEMEKMNKQLEKLSKDLSNNYNEVRDLNNRVRNRQTLVANIAVPYPVHYANTAQVKVKIKASQDAEKAPAQYDAYKSKMKKLAKREFKLRERADILESTIGINEAFPREEGGVNGFIIRTYEKSQTHFSKIGLVKAQKELNDVYAQMNNLTTAVKGKHLVIQGRKVSYSAQYQKTERFSQFEYMKHHGVSIPE